MLDVLPARKMQQRGAALDYEHGVPGSPWILGARVSDLQRYQLRGHPCRESERGLAQEAECM